MRTTYDFAPVYRTSIGFDRMLNALEAVGRLEAVDKWPPYDIARSGEDDYRITMAVAGFSLDQLDITQEQNMLVVSGHVPEDGDAEYLHRGIAARSFQRRFQLADHVEVVKAALENGLLTIDLKRELPDEMKPRQIEIATAGSAPGQSGTPRLEAADKAA